MRVSIQSKKNTPKKDFIIAMLVGIGLTSKAIEGMLRFIFSQSFGSAIIGTYAFLFLWVMFLAMYYLVYGRKDFQKTIVLEGIYMFCMFFMYVLFPNTQQYYEEYADFLIEIIILGIPLAVLLTQVKDFEWLLQKNSILLRLVSSLFIVTYFMGILDFLNYMNFGTRIQVLVLVYYMYIFRNRNKLDIALFVCLFSLLFMAGRQNLILVLLGIVVSYLLNKNTVTGKRTLFYLVCIFVFILFLLYWEDILLYLQEILEFYGIESRFFTALVQGTLINTSNRTMIYQYCHEIIYRNGIKISGLFADRYYLRAYRNNIAYAHNFIYELLIDFGWIMGGAILLSFFYIVLQKALRIRKEYMYIYIIFFVIGFGRLMVSSSIVIDILPFYFLGILFNKYLNDPRRRRRKITIKR